MNKIDRTLSINYNEKKIIKNKKRKFLPHKKKKKRERENHGPFSRCSKATITVLRDN